MSSDGAIVDLRVRKDLSLVAGYRAVDPQPRQRTPMTDTDVAARPRRERVAAGPFTMTVGSFRVHDLDHDPDSCLPAKPGLVRLNVCRGCGPSSLMGTGHHSRLACACDPIKERPVANHEVRLTTKNLLIAEIDLTFDVKRDGSVLSTLEVSEGGLRWRSRSKARGRGVPITWSEFAEWAES